MTHLKVLQFSMEMTSTTRNCFENHSEFTIYNLPPDSVGLQSVVK